MSEIRSRKVLQSVLIQVLANSADGLKIRDVYDCVESGYDFPNDWYRAIPASQGYDVLKELSFTDWREIPQDKLVLLIQTEPQWQNEMRWARNDLREQGLLDGSSARGIWKLTPKGFDLAKSNTYQDLNEEEVKFATKTSNAKPITESLGQREHLEKQLSMHASSMSISDLALLVDIAKSMRLHRLN